MLTERFIAGSADIAVIGAGHAGIEAALAAARTGKSVLLFTLNLDMIGNMPCNPSIGGTGKGHLVFEIDALGGEMGRKADAAMLQCRMLNISKGPAVHSLRYQVDRRKYSTLMKQTLEEQEGVRIIQSEIADITLDENSAVNGVVTSLGAVYGVRAAIITAGTYLKSNIILGKSSIEAGPDNSSRSEHLSDNLAKLGVEIMRFKTGTPPRIHRRSVDFSKLELQEGDCEIIAFSEDTPSREGFIQHSCHTAYTNEETHHIIRENLHLSPLYSGQIKGTGARYCPSIEDKVVRFADKKRHQLFIEPMGENTSEMYVQGLSSSLPEEVQIKVLHSIVGLENAEIMRNAYAIEYDCSNPLQLYPTLEFKNIAGLYGAGQFNGTSGYEEAAAQGLVAGINASLKLSAKEPMILGRASSYIGMLIDDLTVKGTNEPYRVMTSRTEYRLILRQDNAGERLSEYGYRAGLLSQERYERAREKETQIAAQIKRLESITLAPSPELLAVLEENATAPITTGAKFTELIRRPELDYAKLMRFDKEPIERAEVVRGVNINVKYEGYIRRQLAEVKQTKQLENKPLSPDMDYTSIKGIRIEAAQKLAKHRPLTLGQASRISGISPADISVLLIYLEKLRRERNTKEGEE